MPEITVSMAAGRTDEQKAGMMRDITQALVKNLGVDADAVVIQINEAPLASQDEGRQDLCGARGGGEEVAFLSSSRRTRVTRSAGLGESRITTLCSEIPRLGASVTLPE